MKKIRRVAIVWPAQRLVVESLFRHFNMLAETASYLTETSKILSMNNIKLSIHDCAAKAYTAKQVADFTYENDIIFLAVNMNNILDSIEFCDFIKSIRNDVKIVVFGEGVCCNPEYFATIDLIDYIIANGQYELGMEIAIQHILNLDKKMLNDVLDSNKYMLENKIFRISNDVMLPENQWGVPNLEQLPLDAYYDIGGGECHITACKGCPFNCEFCNEKHVSTKSLRYRPVNQIVSYMEKSSKYFNTIYLDSSTFTYDKTWVKKLCDELIKNKNKMKWKTCTRLDCLDEELIELMAKSGCHRISVGVESLSEDIQNRNEKSIDMDKLKMFKNQCLSNNILPRVLMIIGLEGDDYDEVIKTKELLETEGYDVRFRIYQNFNFLLNTEIENITENKLKSIDRIKVPDWIEKSKVNFYRQLEYRKKTTN